MYCSIFMQLLLNSIQTMGLRATVKWNVCFMTYTQSFMLYYIPTSCKHILRFNQVSRRLLAFQAKTDLFWLTICCGVEIICPPCLHHKIIQKKHAQWTHLDTKLGTLLIDSNLKFNSKLSYKGCITGNKKEQMIAMTIADILCGSRK